MTKTILLICMVVLGIFIISRLYIYASGSTEVKPIEHAKKDLKISFFIFIVSLITYLIIH